MAAEGHADRGDRTGANFASTARKKLDDAGLLCTERGIAFETRLCEMRGGRVADVIAREARNLGCDLIVIGTHDRRGVERLLLGSDAEQLLRRSPVPVLLVRLPEPEADARAPSSAAQSAA